MATGGIALLSSVTGGTGQNAYSGSGITGNFNPTGLTGVYSNTTTGPVYCIQAYGGYATTQQFDTIHRLTETVIGRFDVTGSVEVLMDVRLFNNKIGITKDSSNINVLNATGTQSYYSDVSNMLNTDSFMISASEFVYDLSTNGNVGSVISVGVLSTIYSDFSNYVATYFGMPNLPSTGATNPNEYGFATLFSNSPDFNPNAGVFDKAAFINLVNAGTTNAGFSTGASMGYDGSGASITPLSGDIIISGITQLLRNAVDVNPFGNRNPTSGTTASDPYDRSNYGVTDGFFANDLFFIPNSGISITLKLAIDQEAFLVPLNNVGSGFLSGTYTSNAYTQGLPAGTGYPVQDISATYDSSFNLNSSTIDNNPVGGVPTNTTFISNTSSSTTLIQRVVQAPLLIRLANLTYSTTGQTVANPTY
jgi:hypothetical protein